MTAIERCFSKKSRAAAKYDLATDDGRLGYLNDAVTILAGVRNAVERELYLSRVAQSTGVAREPIAEQIKKAEKEGREWQEPYLAAAMEEAKELIDVAERRKGYR